MRLTYQTSVATFIQFVIVSLFTLVSQAVSTVSSCHQNGSNCVSNLLVSIIFYIVVAVAFGGIWLVGYGAQARRSRRLAQLLICIEAFFALLALLSIKLNASSRSAAGLFASFGMLILSAWVLTLAFRLMRAGNRRVVNRQRRPPS
jgi:magnesium-transporting ATPase (P-type)